MATVKTLGPKQAAFVREYLVDLNATQAAIRAGYSEGAAESQGSRLLSNAKVRAEVDDALRRRAERVEVKQDDVLRELLRIMSTDVGEAFDGNGALKPLKEIPLDIRRAIAAVEVIEMPSGDDGESGGLLKKVKFWDKTKALELLGKHLKLFTEKHEVAGKDGGALEIVVRTVVDAG